MVSRQGIAKAGLFSGGFLITVFSFQEFLATFNSHSVLMMAMGIGAIIYAFARQKDSRKNTETAFSMMLILGCLFSLAGVCADFSNVIPIEVHRISLGASDVPGSGSYDPEPIPIDPFWLSHLGKWLPVAFTGLAGALIVGSFVGLFKVIRESNIFSRWEVVRGTVCLYVATGLFFAACYKLMPGTLSNSGARSDFDYIYFSFVCLSKPGGSGDLLAQTEVAKALSIMQSFLGGFVLLGLFVAGAMRLPDRIANEPSSQNKCVGTESSKG